MKRRYIILLLLIHLSVDEHIVALFGFAVDNTLHNLVTDDTYHVDEHVVAPFNLAVENTFNVDAQNVAPFNKVFPYTFNDELHVILL